MASKEIDYKEQTFKLAYELLNPAQDEVLLVLHGWGSNKEIMRQAFGKTLAHYKHIYLDLPGFGHSNNDIILTTQDYATIVKLFLKELGVEPRIAMGHSFGGKVSTLLGTPCLVLLSSSGILVEKPFSVKLKIAFTKLLKPFGLKKIRAWFVAPDAQGMSHAMYETFKNVVNEHFEDNFVTSPSKTLCFWGKEDTATPLHTGEKIASLIQDSQFYALEGDHFFFLKHTAFISQTITEHCKGTH